MATPDVFGLNKLKKTMEHNIMEETVRPRRNNAWTMHKRHQIKISNHFDSHQSRLRKTIPGEHDESVPQSYNTRTKQKGITSGCNTIKVVKTFTDYCDRCSLHGLKYVGDLQLHPLER
ncbi:hypothetical protein L798_11112 [Zootermopsis nevadensis]|uniref:Uncharacterized protein n=3 Tax=Zootermopsis nevadensis TaxID=136037 RepID=A0A067QZG3_ZOONE|nr:hypothetical protein L798_11112 [Zootermopsis nevadensis]